LIVTPFTFAAFQITALRKFFTVRSSNFEDFLEDKGKGPKRLREVGLRDYLGVVLASSPLGCCCRNSSSWRLSRLLTKSERMLEEELNVEHLLK